MFVFVLPNTDACWNHLPCHLILPPIDPPSHLANLKFFIFLWCFGFVLGFEFFVYLFALVWGFGVFCFIFCLFVNLLLRSLLGHFGKVGYFAEIDVCGQQTGLLPHFQSPRLSHTDAVLLEKQYSKAKTPLCSVKVKLQLQHGSGPGLPRPPCQNPTTAAVDPDRGRNGRHWKPSLQLYTGLWQRGRLGPVETPAAREKQIDSQ